MNLVSRGNFHLPPWPRSVGDLSVLPPVIPPEVVRTPRGCEQGHFVSGLVYRAERETDELVSSVSLSCGSW